MKELSSTAFVVYIVRSKQGTESEYLDVKTPALVSPRTRQP
jgi:hypothetical protein